MINKFILMAILNPLTIINIAQAADKPDDMKDLAISADLILRSSGIDPDTFGKKEDVGEVKAFYNVHLKGFVAWQERWTDKYRTTTTVIKYGTSEYHTCAETTVDRECFNTVPSPEVVSLLKSKIFALEQAPGHLSK